MAAIVASIVVVGAVWSYWRRPVVLWAAVVLKAAFALLDIVEVSPEVAKAHTTLVVLAGAVAVLHLAAAAPAFRVVTTRSALEPAIVS